MTIGEKDKKRIYTIPRTNEVLSRDGYGARHLKDIKLNDACHFCGKNEPLPFKCSYCGGVFCGDHRIPEKHDCPGSGPVKTIVISKEMEDEMIKRMNEQTKTLNPDFEPRPARGEAEAAVSVEEYNARYGFKEKMVPPDPMASYPKANVENAPSTKDVNKPSIDEKEEKGIVAWLKRNFRHGSGFQR